MSAIAGIVSLNRSPVSIGLIEGLTRSMTCHGSEGTSHWVNGNVALGHCTPTNTPDSVHEKQPLVSSDNSLVLVFDGRLDNRTKLLKTLKREGFRFESDSDAEITLNAFRCWQDECASHMLGDFAFAIWDIRQQKLFCARDQVGGRRFYYVAEKQFIAFASNEESLANLSESAHGPYPDLVAHFLVSQFDDWDPEQTWLAGIKALLPAHFMTITPDGIYGPRAYWEFQLGDESKYDSDQDCKNAFLDVFGEAVRCRLRQAGEPAAMISGGMDSASLAAMLMRFSSELPNGKYDAYSAVSDNVETSLESRCILSMTAPAHVQGHSVQVPSFKGMLAVEDLLHTVWSKTHPVDNSILLPGMMCLAASRDGHKVMLHAVSGDVTMGYFPTYIAPLIRKHHLADAWQECKAASQHNTFLQHHTASRILTRNAWEAFVPAPVTRQIRRGRAWSLGKTSNLGLINPDFAKKLSVIDRIRARAGINQAGYRQEHAASAFGVTGIRSGLSGYQRVASRFGVELRDPWADKRVLEFFLHLPLRFLVHKGWTKYIARATFEPDVGSGVVWRSDKEHLGWLLTQRIMSESVEFIDKTIKDDLAVLEDYVDMTAARKLYTEYKSSAGMKNQQAMYDLMTLICWVKRVST